MIKLRKYQEDFINDLRKAIVDGNTSICAVLPTGAGKTIITGAMIKSALEQKQKKCWFIVHRNELITQTAKKFDLFDLDYGFITAGEKYQPGKNLYLAMNRTLLNRFDSIPEEDLPDLIFIDESHHIRAGEYEKLLQKILSKKKPIIIGLTATPKRLDGKGLKDCFQTIVLGPKVKDLMEMGNLSKYKIVAPPNDLDNKKIATRFGDYDQKELAKQIEQADIFGGLVWNYKRYLDGKNLIVFAQNVDHSKKITQIYNEAGIPAAHLDGTMSQAERQKIIQGFEAGEIKVISNCFLISEGFDVPACGGIQLVRKTKSEALYLQMVGRALRPENGKEHAIILDHCKNWEENGFPCDDREWKLEYPKKRKSEQTAPVKRCFYCYAVNHASARACLDCGHVFPIETTKKDPKSLDGELVYIDIDGIRKKFGSKEEKNQYVKDRLRYCREESDFRALALQVGYKPSWGWVKYQLRIKKFKGNIRGSQSGFNKGF